MAGSGILYKLVRPIADAIVDAIVDRLFEPKRVVAEEDGAGDELVPTAAAIGLRKWLFESNADRARPDYAPQDQPVVSGARGDQTTVRIRTGSDDGHSAGVGDPLAGSNRPSSEGR